MQAGPGSPPSLTLRGLSSSRRRKSSTPHQKRESRSSEMRTLYDPGDSSTKECKHELQPSDSHAKPDIIPTDSQAPGLVSSENAAVSPTSAPTSPVGKLKQRHNSPSVPHDQTETIRKTVSSGKTTCSPSLKPKSPKRKVTSPKATPPTRKAKPRCRKYMKW